MVADHGIAPDAWALDEDDRLLLRAAIAPAAMAAEAYRAWRQRVPLDDISVAAFRLLPGLIQTALQQGVEDTDMPRIRGVIRYTWLANQLRIHTLQRALDVFAVAGIEVMVLKGAALFARYPHLAAVRGTGDYDLLVRCVDVPGAARALIAARFRPQVIRVDHFAPRDFDKIHACHFTSAESRDDGGLDLHWRPLPAAAAATYVDGLFAHAETATLGAREVRVPALADHLALAVCRPTSWEPNELVLRAAEAGFLLKGCGGDLDWDRFVTLVRQFGGEAKARRVLELVRDATGPTAPSDVIASLATAQSRPPLRAMAERALPAAARARIRQARGVPGNAAQRWWRGLRTRLRRRAIPRDDRRLQTIWREQAARETTFRDDRPDWLVGFSFPETQGRWSSETMAAVAIPVTAAIEGPLTLRATALPFCAPGADSFALDYCIGPDACRRHVIRFGEGVPATVVIPDATVLASPRRIVLVLRLLDASAPASFGLSDDRRELGLMLQRLEILDGTSVVQTIDCALPPVDVER